MFLKKIIAQGFKSFADKIEIDIDKGITGIVGPNGSGKSNVVDAVRWVLGEQSVKSLRGDANMTDVIFSGSKSRHEASFAMVTLIFDNQDHYLPIEFSEVAIKRKVHKDGTNEFYINGEKCRLKDISDLFIDSGVAKESFNIISQGKIDDILSNKPLDRRTIFEEAAGVLKYKKRKEEAIRKLERTHINMNRVNDIISELNVSLEPLKKQSEEAKKYISAKEELEKVEVALIVYDITKFNDEYQLSKDKIEILEKEVIRISTSNTHNETKILEYKAIINKLDDDINAEQNKLIKLTSNVEKLNTERQMILERQKYQANDLKIHNNIVNLKEEELKLTNEISLVNQELTNKNDEFEEINVNINNKNNDINNLKARKKELNDNLNTELRLKNNLSYQIELLQNSIETNNNLPYPVKSILNNPKLRGIHNTVGKLIDTEETFKTALNTILSGSYHFIVVDNENSAKEAINYLKTNKMGRATFYPLNIIKPKEIETSIYEQLKNINGFVDIASNLVTFDDKYRTIFLNLLGNVIVVKNIDSANEISRLINYRYRIVTLDGELFHVGGSLTGGASKNSKQDINEKWELDRLTQKIEKSKQSIKNIEEEINALDKEMENITNKLYEISALKINLSEYINNKKHKLIELNENLNLIKQELETLSNIEKNTLSDAEEKIMSKYYDCVKEKEELSNIINGLILKKKTVNDELIEYEDALKKENSVVSKKQNELKELEIKVNRYDVKLDTLLNTLTEEYNMTYEKAKESYYLDINIDEARKQVTELKNVIKNLGTVNLGAPDEFERINTKYQFLTKQKEDLFNAENTLLEIIKEMDSVMKEQFLKTFKAIQSEFKIVFKELFKGGRADLKLTDPDNILETGIEIIAEPPGKKLTSINLLSGGEKTFTAISLLFAILRTRPVPFSILDEVEAALDEVNVASFGNYLSKFKEQTQFIVITHKKKTMEFVDNLYGITMQESGVSKLVSVRLVDIDKYAK